MTEENRIIELQSWIDKVDTISPTPAGLAGVFFYARTFFGYPKKTDLAREQPQILVGVEESVFGSVVLFEGKFQKSEIRQNIATAFITKKLFDDVVHELASNGYSLMEISPHVPSPSTDGATPPPFPRKALSMEHYGIGPAA